jgi:response regulator of citrate/malate metabolism
VTEQEQLEKLCRGLGADNAQARTMAAQLSKRADQLAHERGISRVEAMRYLLQLVVKGRAGETPPGFEGSGPPPRVV